MKRTRLPYTAFKTVRGKPTWYYRRGKTWVKLPGDPGQDPEAATAYWAARSGTGQRVGDVLRMFWDDIEDDGINVTQGKTGEVLWVPFTGRLRAYLATLERGARTTIVRSERGEPMTYGQVEYRARAPRKRAGATAYSFHGLRYNAASELFEAGCTDAQVQAITGHRTRAMVAKYGKGANQRRLAREARSRQK